MIVIKFKNMAKIKWFCGQGQEATPELLFWNMRTSSHPAVASPKLRLAAIFHFALALQASVFAAVLQGANL
jgi:hypothetical protein